MTKEELIAELRDEHGIDVEELQEQAAQRTDMSELTKALTEALKPSGTLQIEGEEGETVSRSMLSDLVSGIAGLAPDLIELDQRVAALERKDAEAG